MERQDGSSQANFACVPQSVPVLFPGSVRSGMRWFGVLCIGPFVLAACSQGGGSSGSTAKTPESLDSTLSHLIAAQHLTGDPAAGRGLPSISDPLPQLGEALFFARSLGGQMDAACASCHHPALGGADGLSMPIGTDAVDPQVMGPGRVRQGGPPSVPRSAPTTFNAGAWDDGLFDDSRIESIGHEPGMNGAGSGIRTPDSPLGQADPQAGPNLPSAQSRFPVTVPAEMLGTFLGGQSHDTIRDALAARLGNYGSGAGVLSVNHWLSLFQQAFGSSAGASSLITYGNIAQAIGEYERSQVFTNTPWHAYVQGDLTAISDSAKHGAQLFLTSVSAGGAGCSTCHSGDLFSDQQHHTRAIPQFGSGKGDGPSRDDDFGRERESGNPADLYAFRTPSLLNIAVTAPYGHTGAYTTLEQIVRHEIDPSKGVQSFFAAGGWCVLPQYQGVANCASLYPDAQAHTQSALQKFLADQQAGKAPPSPHLTDSDVSDIVAFLQTLTDPCVTDRACLAPWIPDVNSQGPDGTQLNARGANGNYY